MPSSLMHCMALVASISNVRKNIVNGLGDLKCFILVMIERYKDY